jgi:endonuclease/exonuclease/phosphatase family metal-dependent hydrolase
MNTCVGDSGNIRLKVLFSILVLSAAAVFVLIGRGLGASAIKTTDKSFTLNVITYNVCGLPDAITSTRGLKGAKKRFPAIGVILRDYDIIGLQEMFISDRQLIENKLRSYYVGHGTDTGAFGKIGSGIYVFSKWPVPRSEFQEWREAHTFDASSHKGFVAMTTRLPDGLEIDAYSLHAQADNYAYTRIHQYEQLLEAMKRFSIGQGRPIIVLGDFNAAPGDREYDWLIDNLGSAGLKIAEPSPRDVDHIFYGANGSGWNISVVECGFKKFNGPDGKALSDHDPLTAELKFEKY